MGYKVLNKNKEVAAVTVTSKKGCDIMLLFILKETARFCIHELLKIALKAIK